MTSSADEADHEANIRFVTSRDVDGKREESWKQAFVSHYGMGLWKE